MDTSVYRPGNFVRKGACFFANKYDRIHGNPLLPISDGATRLRGTREEMVELMQKSEVCYVYENSAVSIEAALCGCPVVLVKTPYFHESWLHDEYGWAGVRWSDEDAPRASIDLALKNSLGVKNRYKEEQLTRFIAETQQW